MKAHFAIHTSLDIPDNIDSASLVCEVRSSGYVVIRGVTLTGQARVLGSSLGKQHSAQQLRFDVNQTELAQSSWQKSTRSSK